MLQRTQFPSFPFLPSVKNIFPTALSDYSSFSEQTRMGKCMSWKARTTMMTATYRECSDSIFGVSLPFVKRPHRPFLLFVCSLPRSESLLSLLHALPAGARLYHTRSCSFAYCNIASR